MIQPNGLQNEWEYEIVYTVNRKDKHLCINKTKL